MAWDVIGHDQIMKLLQHDLAHGRLRQAYLFTGPAGIGKRTLVREFARALLCVASGEPAVEAQETPCNWCRHCRLAAKSAHPDLLLVAPEESGRRIRTAKIKIEPVRRLIYELTLRPVEARRRVACLLDFETANVEAQNAFLKTLEEPPLGVVILLTAERADDLLPTIVSRCEVLSLRPLPLGAVRQALSERWRVPAERADLLAHISGGRLGWAVRAQDEEATLAAERVERLEAVGRLLKASRVERFAYAEQLARESNLERVQTTLEVWLSFWRDVLLAAAGASAPMVNIDFERDVRRLAERLSPVEVRQIIAAGQRTAELLAKNVNTRLALEVLLLDWPRLE